MEGDMKSLSGKKILLGITGSIAAYKALQIVRDITASGGEVQVVLTPAAHHFVPSLTLQTFSKKPVLTDLFAPHGQVIHVTLARSFDLILIAPTTADFMAKMALGFADDLLSNLLLSTDSATPVLIAPAMDLGMWDHPAVQKNIALLKERGCVIIDPEWGPLASGLEGMGRMANEAKIFNSVCDQLSSSSPSPSRPLAGEVTLVTAGPTQESIDPIRFISNRSSGKMGYAIAEVAGQWGAEVILISGPTALPNPDGGRIKTVRVQSAEEMKREVEKHAPDATIIVMAAAVSDYRPAHRSDQKIKKSAALKSITLQPTEDILMGLAKHKKSLGSKKIVVGFAAETEHLYENALAKLRAKQLDLIVANDVTQAGAGFDVDTNIVEIIRPDGHRIPLSKMSKKDVAQHILNEVIRTKEGQRLSSKEIQLANPIVRQVEGHTP